MMVCGNNSSCRTLVFVRAVKPALEDGDAHCFLAFQCALLKPELKSLHLLKEFTSV